MKTLKWLLFSCVFVSRLAKINSDNQDHDTECKQWSKENFFNTNDRYYTNTTPIVIHFNRFNELNRVCSNVRFDKMFLYAEFVPSKELFLENDLDLRNILKLITFGNEIKPLIFQSVKGFNQIFNKPPINAYLSSYYIQFYNTYFNFLTNSTVSLTEKTCLLNNFNKKNTGYFGSMENVMFTDTTVFSNQVCPYVFMNTHLKSINFEGISNSFLYKNQLQFINANDSNDIDLNIQYLELAIFGFYYEHLTKKNMNKLVFSKAKTLVVHGIVYDIQTDLFASFKNIRYIVLKLNNLKNFLQSGTKWVNYLNADINVNHSRLIKSNWILNRVVLIEMLTLEKIFRNDYDYPNEDICIFKEFPHNQLVYPVIQLEQSNHTCSCTVIWLIQYSKVYLNNDFTYYDDNIQAIYFDTDRNFAGRLCFHNNDLQQQIKRCNFDDKFKSCRSKKYTPSEFGYMSTARFLKWIQYGLDVLFKPALCLIGIVTNSLTIILMRNKKKKKIFQINMYKHMLFNAYFNLIFCLLNSFSLINVCIYPRTSFCSSVYKESLSQYFKIYGIKFFGEAIRFSCNFSYFTFSISRFFVSTSARMKWKCLTCFEHIKLKSFLGFTFLIGLLLNLFKIFEYQKTESYSIVDTSFPFNAYTIEYCENHFIFTSKFAFRCKIFPILSLINSILNNIIFLFVSVIIDIFLISFSNKNLRRKKMLTNDKQILDEAARLREIVNKMIITNGSLFFASHFPQFLSTLAFFVLKNNLSIFCFYDFSCDEFLELIQTFHFISISFHFIVYYKFDKNIRDSFNEKKFNCFFFKCLR